MRLALFRSLRGQASMERYARALSASLKEADPSLEVEALPGPDFPRRPFHWRKYVSYQRAARRWAGEVNHVIDHGYGHLALSLPAGRTLVTLHDMGPLWPGRGRFKGREGGWRAAAAYGYSVRAMKRAARIVAVSESARRDLLEHTGWPEERVKVVLSGVEERFRPVENPGDTLAKLGIAGRRFLLHVGGSSARKNLATVVRALPLLDGEIFLVKAGAPLEEPERRLLQQLGLAGRLMELGPVDEELLPALYSAAEALVFPSLYEGFGWPPLEAMACGTPAVIAGIPALREVAGPGAVMVDDPEDPEQLSGAVKRCLRGAPEREEIIARGRARAAEFTWERAASAYLDIYRDIIEEARR